jgi:hypothetical protein
MSKRFIDWEKARDYAVKLAKDLNLDVAIRGTKEFGRKGCSVSLASKNDSDYSTAEIVKPDDMI